VRHPTKIDLKVWDMFLGQVTGFWVTTDLAHKSEITKSKIGSISLGFFFQFSQIFPPLSRLFIPPIQ
jgi:hypothetical protein